MSRWPDQRVLELFGIELPIIQAPMAGNTTPELVIAVCEAGGLGSLACAQYDLQQAREAMAAVRAGTRRPFNVNFFCHRTPAPDAVAMLRWRAALAPYYVELGLDSAVPPPAGGRSPFDADFCGLVEEFRPEVVSFHFGLPDQVLLDRVKAAGSKIIASATTVAEARICRGRWGYLRCCRRWWTRFGCR
jgi:nitronate monooxygenase